MPLRSEKGKRPGRFAKVKRAIPTLALAVFTASVLFLVLEEPNASAASAAAKPTPTPKASHKKGVCGDTKSKWAHIQCVEFNASAPGDEYFGRMKMSYLGIDNTYKDGAISAGDYTTDARLISKLDFATEALRRWAAKYPNDPQLPRSYFLGIAVLRKVYTESEQQTTWQFIQLLVTRYGNTYFGKVTKASLVHGYTEHWFALAQICPTPLAAEAMASEAPASETPAATPSPSPAPGHVAVDIMTPPCVQPTPLPDESPGPVASPSQAPK